MNYNTSAIPGSYIVSRAGPAILIFCLFEFRKEMGQFLDLLLSPTNFALLAAPNSSLYMLTGKKCNFCTYIVSDAPNGPAYMLTGKMCNFCTYIVTGAPNGPPILVGLSQPLLHKGWT